MATAKRRAFHEMDHDHELLREEIVYANRTELRGPVPEFLAKKRAEQAPGTAAGYEVVLGVFERFCKENGIETVGQIAEGVAHDFITAERERGMSALTIQDRVRRLKTWTRWLRRRGWTERDRWEDVQTPRADLAEFDLIDTELRRAAFAHFDARTFLGARNQAILALLSDCGVRRDELCIIKDADVDLKDMQVRVYAPKTRQTRWRIVPFSEETAAVLANYVRLRERYLARPSRRRVTARDDGPRAKVLRRLETDCFLISQSGGQLEGESVASVLDRLSVRLQEQGFAEAHLHAHLFRHDYITRKALDGENPSVLKRCVGHRTFSMTDRYFGIAESKLAAVRPKRSVLEGIVALPQKTRGRPPDKAREDGSLRGAVLGPRAHSAAD
jgi:site-specific recombinase XerD